MGIDILGKDGNDSPRASPVLCTVYTVQTELVG